jgi:molybdenum cofactor synthesis domain-containing protein
MDVIIVAIGDEVVRGQTVNTNAAFLAKSLTQEGFKVIMHVALTDDIAQLQHSLPQLAQQCALLVTTGGLGPTTDDRTRTALAVAFNWRFIQHDGWLCHLEQTFTSPQHALLSQAKIAEGAFLLENPEGTACGFIHRFKESYVAVLPGVPGECRAMTPALHQQLIQIFSQQAAELRLKLHFFGIYERYLDYALQQAAMRLTLTELTWGLYPDVSTVTVVLQGPLEQQKAAEQWLYGLYQRKSYSGDLLKDLVLVAHSHHIVIIESITAGLMRWQSSQNPELAVVFDHQDNHQGWCLSMRPEDRRMTLIQLTKKGEIFAQLAVPTQGSLTKQQQRLTTLGFGLLLECLTYGASSIVTDPTVSDVV